MSRISPIVLLIIVILAVLFFLFGVLHLLIRYFIKRSSFPSISQSRGNPDSSASHALQRQLQQLFRLHDSGLDQAIIDSLPVFYYKDIMGSKEPFDCAVCLCEFSDIDKLRLLPICSHAFHIHCIDTWLLSNSTCPLCRSLISSGVPMGNPLFGFDEAREPWDYFPATGENELSAGQKPGRVFSVRLGKFRNVNAGCENGNRILGEVSSCNLDARRCYSMGSFQYVLVDSDLQVALPDVCNNPSTSKMKLDSAKLVPVGDREAKKISARTRGESFSVSKIWLWSKKSKFPGSSEANISITPPHIGMPRPDRTGVV